MPSKRDTLQEFRNLHQQLQQERQQLQTRLAELQRVLGNSTASSAPGNFTVARPGEGVSSQTVVRNKLSMREAVQHAIAAKPLGVREIVEALHGLGFKFRSKNPYNSVGAYLYGKEGRKYFNKVGRTFVAK